MGVSLYNIWATDI